MAAGQMYRVESTHTPPGFVQVEDMVTGLRGLVPDPSSSSPPNDALTQEMEAKRRLLVASQDDGASDAQSR